MKRYLKWLTGLALLAGVSIRLVGLEADPDYYSWYGYYVDEGRWTEVARHLGLHGTIRFNPRNYNTIVAPAFEVASAISFQLFGVSHATARLFPALCGAGTLVALFLYLRRRTSALGVFCGVALLATQTDLVNLSRVAVPETASMLGALLAWIAVDAARGRRAALAGAGCVLMAALAFKVTSYLLVPAFALVVYMQRPDAPTRARLADAAALFSVPALAGGIGLAVMSNRLSGLDPLLQRAGALSKFVKPDDLYAMVSHAFNSVAAPFLNGGLLVLWLGVLALVLVPRSVANEPSGARGRLVGAMVWTVTFLVVMFVQAYFPIRYMAHIFVPLSLVAAFSVARLEAAGLGELTSSLRDLSGARKALAVGLVCLPTIAVVAPVGAALLGGFGLPTERLSIRLLALALTGPPILMMAPRWLRRERGVGVALAFPIAATLGWLMAWAWSEGGVSFWPDVDTGHGWLGWTLILALLFGAIHTSVGLALRRGSNPIRAGGALAALLWIVAWSGLTMPGLLAPSYSLRDAARDLHARLPAAAELHQFRADSLFIGNAIDYALIDFDRFGEELPAYVVVPVGWEKVEAVIGEHYELVTHYNLHVSSRYRWRKKDVAEPICGKVRGNCIGVYALRGQAEPTH